MTRILTFGACGLLAIAFFAWLLHRGGDTGPVQALVGAVSQATVGNQSSPETAVAPRLGGAGLREADLKKPGIDCRIFSGRGISNGLAVAVTGSGTSTRLSVLNQDGTLLAMDLDFVPGNVQAVRRSDGSLLLGAADPRKNSKTWRDPSASEPVLIARDRAVLYESEKAYEFALADDGSSFYVIEPTSDSASRLIIRNLDSGTESHFDLGDKWTPFNDELLYTASYLPGDDAVLVAPSSSSAPGQRYFFSTSTESVTVVTPPAPAGISSIEFLSREDVVRARRIDEQRVLVSRVHLGNERAGSADLVWSQELPISHFYGSISLSSEGDWIVVHGWDTYVVSAETGRVAFRWPIAGNRAEEMRRLAGVLPDDVNPSDIGSVTGISVEDGVLLMTRTTGLGAFADCHTQADTAACVRAAREQVVEYMDVFPPMSEIGIDSGPAFRVKIANAFGCQAHGVAPGRLAVVDGRITYDSNR